MIADLLRIAAPDIRRIPPLAAFKPGDQSWASNSGWVFDTDLYLDLEADSTYRILVTAYYTFPNLGPVQCWLATPEPAGTADGWTLSYSGLAYSVASNSSFLAFGTVVQPRFGWGGYGSGSASAPVMQPMLLAGTVRTTNAGSLAVAWNAGAAASSPTATVNAGSELDAWKTG